MIKYIIKDCESGLYYKGIEYNHQRIMRKQRFDYMWTNEKSSALKYNNYDYVENILSELIADGYEVKIEELNQKEVN